MPGHQHARVRCGVVWQEFVQTGFCDIDMALDQNQKTLVEDQATWTSRAPGFEPSPYLTIATNLGCR